MMLPQQVMRRITRLAVSRYCTGAGPGPISAIGVASEVIKLVARVTLVMATIAEASREAPEAVYTCPGLLDRVLVRLEAAAVARALPAVVGKVTSVFKLIVATCAAVRILSLIQISKHR